MKKFLTLFIGFVMCIALVLLAAFLGGNFEEQPDAVQVQENVPVVPFAPVQPSGLSDADAEEKEAMKKLKLNP